MDLKEWNDPKIYSRSIHAQFAGAIHAQFAGAIHAAGLTDSRWQITDDVYAGRPVDMSGAEWACELTKHYLLRERLSPVSLLSPPPAWRARS